MRENARHAALLITALAVVAVPASGAVGKGRCGDLPCRADVSVSGHAEPQPIHKNETTTLKITPKNDGPDAALDIDLQVDVPRQLKIKSVEHYGGLGCSVDGTFVRCDMGDFNDQQLGVVKIKLKGKRKGTWISEARVYASDVDDPNGGNGQVSISVLVQGRS